MSRNVIALIAALASFSGIFPYIRDVIKGKTHPNLVSWATWCLLNLINTAAALSTGAFQTALLSGASALATGWVTFLSIRHGKIKYTAFDIVCQALALAGIVVWRFTGQPEIAVLIAVSIDLVAALPTWRHAWIAPFNETWQGFSLAACAAMVTLFTISQYTLVSLAFPLLVLTNCSVIVSIILYRRSAVGRRRARRLG
jgi:hypothetical protein